MKVEWMFLADYAKDEGGLLTLVGATWDTVNVVGPPPPQLEGTAVAVFQGYLVIRLLLHSTETDRTHSFRVIVMDEDGQPVHELPEGDISVERSADIPPGWEQGVHLILGLSGMPLPRFGFYSFSLLIDGQHVTDRPFRVVRG